MKLIEKHCWAEIDVANAKSNFQLIKNTSDRNLYAVVKADAYGHGASYLAKIYEEMGAYGLCVATFCEAIALRKAGITKPILILGYTDPALSYELFKNNLSQCVFSYEYAQKLNTNALYPIDCHLKLDTGMGRIGFDVIGDKENAYLQMKQLLELHNLKFTGIFSHFSVADCLEQKEIFYTEAQINAFEETLQYLVRNGFEFKTIHGQNSAGISRKLGCCYNAMRAGIILYGEAPSQQVTLPGLKKLMQLKALVTHVKTIHEGQSAGYGLCFTAQRQTKLATIACGYADGLPRALKTKQHTVKINGVDYLVVAICMDQIMADITGSDVKVEDEALVMGGEGNTSFDAIAQKVDTVNYEIMCSVSKRVPRVYIENEKIVHIENYI